MGGDFSDFWSPVRQEIFSFGFLSRTLFFVPPDYLYIPCPFWNTCEPLDAGIASLLKDGNHAGEMGLRMPVDFIARQSGCSHEALLSFQSWSGQGSFNEGSPIS